MLHENRHHTWLLAAGVGAIALSLALLVHTRSRARVPEPVPSLASPALPPRASEVPIPRRAPRAIASSFLAKSADAGAPLTEAEQRMAAHWKIATTPRRTAAEAESAYQASLEELRRDVVESVRLLRDAYWNTPELHHETRLVLTSTLADLGSDEAFEPLRDIATDPVPPERFEDSHDASSQSEERIIRMIAIDGLAGLAKAGNGEADAELLAMATDPGFASQRAGRIRAIRGYLAAGADTEARAETLRSHVPEDLHWAISLRQPTRDDVYAHIPPAPTLD